MDLKTTPRATSQIPRLEGNQNSVGKGNWNQMWPAEPRKNESKEEVTGKRVETTISRQFLPKKKQGVSEAWSKQTLENREDLKQPFPYTPFKSGTLKKATSINTLRGSAFNSHFNQDVSQIYGTQQQSCKLRTVPNVQETMRAHYDANNIYSTSGILHQESKGMWKGAPSGMTAPPSGPYRPASVINAPLLARPSSRANSDLGIGNVGFCNGIGGISSRYQSYCTLPRPEQTDFDQRSNYGNEISQMAKHINQLYGSYNTQQLQQPSVNANTIVAKQTVPSNNRQMSSMLSGAPGMASDYLPRHHSIYGVTESNALPQMSDDEILKPAKEIIHFDALSLLSVLQVLCSLVISGCGVLRIIWNSKWAIGLEIIFALLVFVAGVTGICATSRRSYGAAAATFTLSLLSCFLSFLPCMLGMLPAIALTFPSVNPAWLLNEDESLITDYLLSFACFAEAIVAIITSIYGCRALGSAVKHVEKLRVSFDLKGTFEGISETMEKNLDRLDSKEVL